MDILAAGLKIFSDGKHGMDTMVDKLYQLDYEAVISEHTSVAMSQVTSAADIWHFRLGHASEQFIKNMAYKRLATGIKLPKQAKMSFCEGCVAGKIK